MSSVLEALRKSSPLRGIHTATLIYKVEIPGGRSIASICDKLSIVLVGDARESKKYKLAERRRYMPTPYVAVHEIRVEKALGELLMVRLTIENANDPFFQSWVCWCVNVVSPNNNKYSFPYYKRIVGVKTVEIPDGKGVILSRQTHPLLKAIRKAELTSKAATIKWKCYEAGIPHCFHADDHLPDEEMHVYYKMEFKDLVSIIQTHMENENDRFPMEEEPWSHIDSIKPKFRKWLGSSDLNVTIEKWEEDNFFGNQFLNGVNPTLIKKCTQIPDNFPVESSMMDTLFGSSNLQNELEKGNIFLVDYKILEGIPITSFVNGKVQYVAAPMCLLWKNPQDQLVPIAIQLSQTPGEKCPIFVPSDTPRDWLLAKIWVRNADYLVHQSITHLLRTHLFAEAFSMATSRKLPSSHPVHKLLIPHLRYTLAINGLCRKQVFHPGGYYDQVTGIGYKGILQLMTKAMGELTYKSLCLPDDIQVRGMDSIPNYLYRDDGMKIWNALERYVSNIVDYYYKDDVMVLRDDELQAWVGDIFMECFMEKYKSGIPCAFEKRTSLIKYLTMVIFTCSAQHAAVNNGQFDFYAWIPNAPSTMQNPPPTAKGSIVKWTIVQALPDMNTSVLNVALAWLMSKETRQNKLHLGEYPDMHFVEYDPQRFIKEFQDELAEISKSIRERNAGLPLPYPYLDPATIENSTCI
ncbi:hydroperoxide isomerase ALOXE3-like [Hyperolius riggenbachi]|uniref:hydroperoxide isomerase ALOXE3-like n=1 Tax=Hyperolius riggenbachi TaxID=752182 RepID=UPI0035A3C45D